MAQDLTDEEIGNILSVLANKVGEANQQTKTLNEINNTLKQLLKNSVGMSATNARTEYGNDTSSFFRSRSSSRMATGKIVSDILSGVSADRIAKNLTDDIRRSASGKVDDIVTSFLDGLETELLDGFGASDFRKRVEDSIKSLADAMGVSVKGIKAELGKELGKRILSTKGGEALSTWAKSALNSGLDRAKEVFTKRFQNFGGISKSPSGSNPTMQSLETEMGTLEDMLRGFTDPRDPATDAAKKFIANQNRKAAFDTIRSIGQDTLEKTSNIPVIGNVQSFLGKAGKSITDHVSSVYTSGHERYLDALTNPDSMTGITKMIATLTGGSTEAGAALSGLTSVVSTLGPEMLLAVIAVKAVASGLKKALQPAIEGTKQYVKAMKEAAASFYDKRDKRIDDAQKRFEADVETLIKTPFELLNKGAQAWYDAWDSNLRTITGTQGYTKADVQSLLASFAERLRDEGLTSVISASDLTSNLTKVLESGLSGTVAEEFAYIATKLNAAIPTQDFFGYAGTYASIAANAIKDGKSQSEAIEYANQQLYQFASNLLYASRDLAGGFTTGLKNAEDLFQKSVQISQASRSGDISQISGVLSSVAAITGAIAPDLASGLIDAVYKAAVGGNNTDIVALRSLAGVNASNTEFLRELTQNPKQVFSDLFNQLANMQSMSPDAYMEVAEGLSSVLGVSMDALARVDFQYLADAVSSMSVNSRSLEENIALLASGETTTEAEQLKMQQINKMILDEGLSYVLDNEAARTIQQHMWDEQLALQITGSSYAVNLEGASLKFLEGISRTVDNILNVVNPIRGIMKLTSYLANIKAADDDTDRMESDIQAVLELGKVGGGNSKELSNLLTRGIDLNLTDPLVDLLGGSASYTGDHPIADFLNKQINTTAAMYDAVKTLNSKSYSVDSSGQSQAYSKYDWGMVGKSAAKALSNTYDASRYTTSEYSIISAAKTASEKAAAQSVVNLQSMLDSMTQYVDANKSYSEFVSEASKQYNISNFTEALESAGLTEESAKAQYDALIGQVSTKQKIDRESREEDFWNLSVDYLNSGNLVREDMRSQNDIMIASLAEQTGWLERLFEKTSDINIKIIAFYDQWVDYFVNHTVYSGAYNHESVSEIQRKEKAGSEDAIYALADALTQNNVDLLDPTMQTNALLAEILKVANALLVKQGATGGGLSLPDTIAGLSLGVVNRV